MNDQRMDLLLKSLSDVVTEPDPAFVDASLQRLMPEVHSARGAGAWNVGRALDGALGAIGLSVRPPMRWLLISLLLVALLIFGLVAAGALRRASSLPPPFGPAGNGAVLIGSGGDLLVADMAGATPRPIVAGADLQVGAAYSNDGTRMSFLRETTPGSEAFELWVANSNGSNPRRIGGPFLAADWYEWSPTGDVIAIQSSVDGREVIDLVDVDGTGSERVDVDYPAARPVWRPPDGKQLLFRGLGSDGFWRLYLWDRAESRAIELDLDPGFESKPVVHECGAQDCAFTDAAWSPDGDALAFATVEPSPTNSREADSRIHLARVGTDGEISEEHLLVESPVGLAESKPTFLPDGSGVIFVRQDVGRTSLHVASIGSDQATVVDLPAVNEAGTGMSYTVSPDGRKLVTWLPDEPSAQLIDIQANSTTDLGVDVEDIVVWQRVAD